MLKFLRNKSHQKKLFWVLAAGIIPSFVIWGVMVESGPNGPGREAGKIGSRAVSTGEFIRNYDALRRELMIFHGVDPSRLAGQMDFEKITWDRILLLDAGRQMGVRTTNDEVLEWLAKQEPFRREGKFDEKIYRQFVERQLRTDARDFEENIRSMLTLRKVMDQLMPKADVTEDEVRKTFLERFGPRHLRYVAIAIDPSDEPAVDEKEVESLYESMKNVLQRPETVNALAVFIPKGSDKDTEAARSALLAGGPEKAADHGLKAAETGFITRQEPFPEAGYSDALTRAVFGLQNKGDLTPWIETDKGAVLARLIERRASEPVPAEEAKADIRKKLVEAERQKKVRVEAEAFHKAAAEKGFDEAAREAGLAVLDAPSHKQGDYLDKAGPLPEFNQNIAPLKPGEMTRPFPTPNGYAVVRVESIAEPAEEEWTKQKEAIRSEITAKRTTEEFGKKMEELWTKLRVNTKAMKALFPQEPATS